jgi:hypothetical protein
MKSFKDFSAILKVLTPVRVIIAAFGIIFLYLIVQQYTSNKAWTGKDMMTNLESSSAESTLAQQAALSNVSASVDTSANATVAPPSVAQPSDLLPSSGPSSLFGGSGAVIEGMDELLPPPEMCNRGRNANLSIRPDPCIPRQSVGIWNNTTIDVNTGGGGCGSGPCSASNNIISA